MSARAKTAHEPEPAPHDALPRPALGHLAAAVVHEIRNRLNPINIHVDLLGTRVRALETQKGDPAAASAAAHRSLEVLRGEVERLDRLLVEYLRFAGPPDAAPVQCDVPPMLKASVDRAAARARARGVVLELEAAGTAMWPIDPEALQLALDALVANAIEASSRGGRVVLRTRVEHSDIFGVTGVIEVEDRGEGLAPDALRQVFEIGYSTRRGHAGLGLSVAKHAVRAMPRAQLSVHSEGLGRGAVARIELALDEIEDDSDD